MGFPNGRVDEFNPYLSGKVALRPVIAVGHSVHVEPRSRRRGALYCWWKDPLRLHRICAFHISTSQLTSCVHRHPIDIHAISGIFMGVCGLYRSVPSYPVMHACTTPSECWRAHRREHSGSALHNLNQCLLFGESFLAQHPHLPSDRHYLVNNVSIPHESRSPVLVPCKQRLHGARQAIACAGFVKNLSTQDIAMEFMLDVRWPPDTLFLLFEEDFRFGTEGVSSQTVQNIGLDNVYDSGEELAVFEERNMSHCWKVLAKSPGGSEETTRELEDIVRLCTVAHRHGCGDFVWMQWAPSTGSEALPNHASTFTALSQEGAARVHMAFQCGEIENGLIDMVLMKWLRSQPTGLKASYLYPPMGGVAVDRFGCVHGNVDAIVRSVRSTRSLYECTCAGTRVSDDPKRRPKCFARFSLGYPPCWIPTWLVQVPEADNPCARADLIWKSLEIWNQDSKPTSGAGSTRRPRHRCEIGKVNAYRVYVGDTNEAVFNESVCGFPDASRSNSQIVCEFECTCIL